MSIYNSYNCGILGFHTKRIAENGFVGLGFTNAPASIAPLGGVKAVVGTNPFSIAVPYKGSASIIIDQSASVVAKSEISVRSKSGESIPEGWAFDAYGNTTTNAKEALKGTMAPSGGYKGFGFGLMAEILASALTGSLSSVNAPPLKTTEGAPHDLGQTYILIDPNFNGEKDHFFKQLNNLTELISSQPNARLPGSNKSNPLEAEIDKDLWDSVNKLADLS